MSEIYNLVQSSDTPIEVKRLYKYFIEEFDAQQSIPWVTHVKKRDAEYHKKIILDRTWKFTNEGLYNLSDEEVLILENYYSFPENFQKSYDTYLNFFKIMKFDSAASFFFHDIYFHTFCNTLAFALAYKHFFNNSFKETGDFEFDFLDIENHFSAYSADNFGHLEYFELGSLRKEGAIAKYSKPQNINGYWCSARQDFINKIITNHFCDNEVYGDFFNYAKCTNGEIEFNNYIDSIYIRDVYHDIEPFQLFCHFDAKISEKKTVIINLSHSVTFKNTDLNYFTEILAEYYKTGCKIYLINQNPGLVWKYSIWEEIKSKLIYDVIDLETINQLNTVGGISNSEVISVEAVFRLENDMAWYEPVIDLFNQKKFTVVERYISAFVSFQEYFVFCFEIDMINKMGHFDLANFITDYAFSTNVFDLQQYYHEKAHIYRDHGLLLTAKQFFEKDVVERKGHHSSCYIMFMKQFFPKDDLLIFDDIDTNSFIF